MRLVRDSVFELSFMPWAIRPPQHALMIVVKATFDLQPGVCAIAEAQRLVDGDVPSEGGASLRTASDYAILKPRGEWYLTGSAHAPGGKPLDAMKVSARVGGLREKELVVWGARDERGAAVPFVSTPLGWELAHGGPGIADNPVGTSAPRVVPRDGRPGRTVGMFAIPSTWPARARLMGTYDDRWKAERWPWLPEDFDVRHFQCAPEDQRLAEGYFEPDTRLDLVGLHPEHGRLTTRLPGVRPRVFVERADGAVLPETCMPFPPRHARADLDPSPRPSPRARLAASGPPRLEEVLLHLDTIVIDSDAGQIVCAWRGLVDVADTSLGDVARIFYGHDEPGAPRSLADYQARLGERILEEIGDDEAMEAIVPAALDPAALDPAALDPAALDPAALAPDLDADPRDQTLDERSPPVMPAAPTKSAREFLQGALELLGELLEDHRLPPVPELRRRLREQGLEPPPELDDVEAPAPDPELDDAPSLIRLAVLLRRRLGRPFAGMDLTGAPLQHLDLSHADLRGATLPRACLAGCDLEGARLDGADLRDADLGGARLRQATLRGADLSRAKAPQVLLDGSCLDDAVLSGADLRGARGLRVSMQDAELERARLDGAALLECDADGASFAYAVLDGADLSRSSLRDASFEGVLARRARVESCRADGLRVSEGADLTDASFALSSLAGAQLQQALLTRARFLGCDLAGADLSEAAGVHVDLLGARLAGACLDGARLVEARLTSASLFEARLEGADLRGSDLRGAQVVAAQLWQAQLEGCRMDGADLARSTLDPEGR